MSSAVDLPDSLPSVPGGWMRDVVDIGSRRIELLRPAQPDEFLEDPQVLEANRRDDYMPYWSYLWPASVPMARALAHAPWPSGTPVLELGSGVGLVGISALARGWRVTFSDYDETSLTACRVNAARNGFLDVETLKLDWRQPLPRRFPVIIGCEVIYEARSHDPILDLIDAMLAEDGCCWIGDPNRSQAPKFYDKALRSGWHVTVRDVEGRECEFPSGRDVHIFELRRIRL